jgi:hypothetical protein
LGAVGADVVGQVVSRMYGWWLGDNGGGGGHCRRCSGMWWPGPGRHVMWHVTKLSYMR